MKSQWQVSDAGIWKKRYTAASLDFLPKLFLEPIMTLDGVFR